MVSAIVPRICIQTQGVSLAWSRMVSYSKQALGGYRPHQYPIGFRDLFPYLTLHKYKYPVVPLYWWRLIPFFPQVLSTHLFRYTRERQSTTWVSLPLPALVVSTTIIFRPSSEVETHDGTEDTSSSSTSSSLSSHSLRLVTVSMDR